MSVHIHVRVCMCVHMYIHMCMFACVCMHMGVYMCVYLCVHMHVYIRVHAYACAPVCVWGGGCVGGACVYVSLAVCVDTGRIDY